MKTDWLLSLSACFLFIAMTDCNNNDNFSVSYAHDIEPIFKTGSSSCYPCHLGGGKSGNLDLSSYAALMAGDSENGPVVRPGDADHSLLYEAVSRPAIEQSILSTRMPQGLDPLSAMQIKLIEDWINEGAIDN